MSDEWGPWIEHDGKGCPCVGDWVRAELRCGSELEGRAGSECSAAGIPTYHPESRWMWTHYPRDGEIIRYRIRKPRGLTILHEILREVEKSDTMPREVERV